MYRVTTILNGVEYLLYDPRDDNLQILEPEVTMQIGKSGMFKFRIPPNHENRDKVVPLKSEIRVYQDGEILFCGRHVGHESDFYNFGAVGCEGELSYLVDSLQRPFEFSGNLVEFFTQVVHTHNSQVEARKQFEVGNITVADTEASITRTSTELKNTLEILKAYCTELIGGHLRVRYANGKKYLDYVHDYGGYNTQVIRFRENLLDLKSTEDPTAIITALVPYGAMIETGEAGEKKRLDITSVNDGKDYIVDQAAKDEYGWIWGKQTFDDTVDADALMQKARAYLRECITLPLTLELTAVDLSMVDVNVERLKVGYWTQVESRPHNISKQFLLAKKVIHLDNPGRDEVVLGRTIPTFTESSVKKQIAISQSIEKVADNASKEINAKVENATALITGGKGGYVVLDVTDPDTGERMHPWRILIMNTPDKETASNVIQLNQNGLGFSTTGINGPYRNAWTIDGNLVADFITAGTMLADRIRGGTLELGGIGLGRDGQIIVRDTSGEMIGSWDKTGLTILRGILQGVSAIFGGVNNQNGAIEVVDASGRRIGRWDKDGLYISKGNLSVGPFEANEDEVIFGDFYVSADGSNVFRSNDGSIAFQAEGSGPLGPEPTLSINGGTKLTERAANIEYLTAGYITGDCTLNNSINTSSRRWAGKTLYEALDELLEEIRNIDTGE